MFPKIDILKSLIKKFLKNSKKIVKRKKIAVIQKTNSSEAKISQKFKNLPSHNKIQKPKASQRT